MSEQLASWAPWLYKEASFEDVRAGLVDGSVCIRSTRNPSADLRGLGGPQAKAWSFVSCAMGKKTKLEIGRDGPQPRILDHGKDSNTIRGPPWPGV